MLFIVYCLLFNFVTGIPLAKLSNTSIRVSGTKDLLSQIMTFKGNDEALLSVLSDADPAKLNEVITLLKALLTTSEAELLGLTTSSNNADTAFTDAVAAHNAAVVAKQDGLGPLATTRDNAITAANTAYDNAVTALQDAIDAAKVQVDSTNSTKLTANGVLAADQGRLNSEITTLRQVIQLMEGLLGLNTFSPTASPTASPTVSAGNDFVPLGYDLVQGSWCNAASYGCFPQYGEVCLTGRLYCPHILDGEDNESCLNAIVAYCNADPRCKAFLRHSQWDWGAYYPCSSKAQSVFDGGMMYTKQA